MIVNFSDYLYVFTLCYHYEKKNSISLSQTAVGKEENKYLIITTVKLS